MTTMATIQDFVGQRTLAIAGVSRSKGKFGQIARRELEKRGYKLHIVHPEVREIAGKTCCADFKSLPEPVGGALIVLPPARATEAVRQALDAGIRRIWLQQGAESPEAIALCRERDAALVHDRCILMFAQPVGFPHSLHRWFAKLSKRWPR